MGKSFKGSDCIYINLALSLAFSKNQDQKSQGDVSHFQALMTALAATIGTGHVMRCLALAERLSGVREHHPE